MYQKFQFQLCIAIHILRQVNILHIRALVKADAVILFDTYGSADSRLHSVFLYHLEVSRHIVQSELHH
jgi:hypothetical protein